MQHTKPAEEAELWTKRKAIWRKGSRPIAMSRQESVAWIRAIRFSRVCGERSVRRAGERGDDPEIFLILSRLLRRAKGDQ
jgi:hypothetical protein